MGSVNERSLDYLLFTNIYLPNQNYVLFSP